MPKLSFDELDRFSHELAHLARGGMPLPEGLAQLASSLDSAKLRRLADETAQALSFGKPLSQALRESSVGVPKEYLAIVECAEASGDMKAILSFANEQSRKIKRHRDAISTSMVYPAVVLAAGVLIVSFFARMILPHVEVMYGQTGNVGIVTADYLPRITAAVFAAGAAVRSVPGALVCAGLLAMLLLLLFRPVRDAAHGVIERLPVFRDLTILSDTAIFSKFLSHMLRRGAPLPLALKAVSLAVWRSADRRMLDDMARTAERGHPVSPLLRGELPSTAVYLFQHGEERGNLPEACEGIADYCEDRFAQLAQRSRASFEPLMIVLVGLAVGLTVIGLYCPIFQIPKMIGMGF